MQKFYLELLYVMLTMDYYLDLLQKAWIIQRQQPQLRFHLIYFPTFMTISYIILTIIKMKIKKRYIQVVSEKYPTCVHIAVLVLFFVIRTVASFEVVPIWLNHKLPAVLPHLRAVLERRFWNGLQLARCITLNRVDFVEPLSFERHI